jgi:short subunit dehydrogenase-like uncharacterized protein
VDEPESSSSVAFFEGESKIVARVSDGLLIYGGNGYTAALLAREALAQGLRPMLCGRDRARTKQAAERFGLGHRVARLDAPRELKNALGGITVVVNAAGPFADTTAPLVAACLDNGVHYLDVSGEADTLDFVSGRHAEARAAGVMLMPGVGFDVVPSDCLARHVVARLSHPRRLSIGITGLRSASRGSARTTIDQIGKKVLVRRGGRLCRVAPASLERRFDYGHGPSASLAVSWADVISAYYSTGVPDIDVYFEATPAVRAALITSRHLGWWMSYPPIQRYLKTWTRFLPEGPGEEERAITTAVVVAEAEDEEGRCVTARLRTPEVYTFTAMTAVAIARRVLGGDCQAGYETPSRIYGSDFVLSFPGVFREDL